MKNNEIFKLVFKHDCPTEIEISRSDCQYLVNCSCSADCVTNKCGYDAESVKNMVSDYYRQKAEYIANQNTVDFLHDFGYYYETEGELYGANNTSSSNPQRKLRTKDITVLKRRILNLGRL